MAAAVVASPRREPAGGTDAPRQNWPEVLIKWEPQTFPVRGTPALAGEAETGNIRSLRLTETDRRKRNAAQKQQKQTEAVTPRPPAKGAGGAAGGSMKGTGGRSVGSTASTAETLSPRLRAAGGGQAKLQPPPLLPGETDSVPDAVPRTPMPSLLRAPIKSRRISVVSNEEVLDAMMATGPRDGGESTPASVDGSPTSTTSGASAPQQPWSGVIAKVKFEPDAPPVQDDPSSSGVLGVAETKSVAKQVQALATKMRKDAHSELTKELEVQLSIWDSGSLMRLRGSALDASMRPESPLTEEFNAILGIMATDPAGSASKLEALVKREESNQGSMVGTSLLKAANKAIRVQLVSVKRDALAKKLEEAAQHALAATFARASGFASTSPRESMAMSRENSLASAAGDTAKAPKVWPSLDEKAQQELEALFQACELTDLKLEYIARRAFNLPMMVKSGGEADGPEMDPFIRGEWQSQSTDPFA
mmetsp:Transcript_21161/g.60480  ORF Transcript_21161/g.60480 Transcript_21161/m.60480 type:complete len:478 (+) Transcript_21161:40-1473(+)|eukprot:CAMPEP_0170252044 /NCGR_PEP_ID=MMETSP0116_2-20130129/25854_1 /TAXON_ID=400756 /ORGANISM="Durinskia baltica, Strain CSIRO CS-38" /LENGTH=477 /DNA_ID=CAMNT_0010503011 /DNA_START=19 /DNA_END=1452 /DNA_ORIENTATION=+